MDNSRMVLRHHRNPVARSQRERIRGIVARSSSIHLDEVSESSHPYIQLECTAQCRSQAHLYMDNRDAILRYLSIWWEHISQLNNRYTGNRVLTLVFQRDRISVVHKQLEDTVSAFRPVCKTENINHEITFSLFSLDLGSTWAKTTATKTAQMTSFIIFAQDNFISGHRWIQT